MWVLSTDRAELHFFPSPETIPGGYAALSHTWNNRPEDGPPEQSFQEIQKIREDCTKTGKNPRDCVGEKIKRCCELAAEHGYKWVWIDTCCIDKTSSAELSEAINSMFRYYALAGICYGYLRDVDAVEFSREDLAKERDLYWQPRYASFVRSIWFERGWTLQELIAPRFFVFLSSSWKPIGTKADFAELLEGHIDIPAGVLRHQLSHMEFSIAQRMSWFGWRRKTTRPEDEAYCLLGLFDIHMPPLYGEGRNAFRRLQEEIMKQSADTTLFAWRGLQYAMESPRQSMFARSPADFAAPGMQIVYTPSRLVPVDPPHDDPALKMPGGDVDDMTFAVTPTGVRACIPIFKWRDEIFADLYWSSGEGRRIFLHLEDDADSQASSFRRPSYRVSKDRLAGTDGTLYACVPDNGSPPVWREVLIRHGPPLHRATGQLLHSAASSRIPPIPMQLTFDAPVRFPEACIRHFLDESKLGSFEVHGAGLVSPWTADSSLPAAYVFRDTLRIARFIIKTGQCQQETHPSEQRGHSSAVWATLLSPGARLSEEEIGEVLANPRHNCLEDHVLEWPNIQKRFKLDYYGVKEEVTLSVAPCPLNPERTLILQASYRQ